MINLPKSKLSANKLIEIFGSKSETNRLLILQKLLGNISIDNISNSQDTALLKAGLSSDDKIINIHHAGTAMRFLTSYLAIQEGRETILTGSERMKQRPIAPLVEALRSLGADITYLENEGFPPLKINGKILTKSKVEVPAHISSQFITSLMLIGSKLKEGLEINLIGKITSRPYLEMTLQLLTELGIKTNFVGNKIKIEPIQHQVSPINYTVESDWSSASYFYSLSAIGREIFSLASFKQNSLQGDSALVEIYKKFFGVETIFSDNKMIELRPLGEFNYPNRIELDMNHCPDIAQTLCVTASAMKIPFVITGLETLKVKETDRLVALQNELLKIGVKTKITDNSIQSLEFSKPLEKISIATYNDHRMAMSFAPFCLIQDLEIQNPSVVEKSYPNFWENFNQVIVNK